MYDKYKWFESAIADIGLNGGKVGLNELFRISKFFAG